MVGVKTWLEYLMLSLVGMLIVAVWELARGDFDAASWGRGWELYFLVFLVWWLILRWRARKFCRTPQPA